MTKTKSQNKLLMKLDFFHKLLALLLFFFAALLFSHFIIFKAFLIPQMEQYVVLPMWLWIVDILPEFIVLLSFGTWFKSKFQILVAAIATGWGWKIFTFLLVINNEPGYLKVYEDAYDFWFRGMIFAPIITSIPLFMGFGVAKFLELRTKLP